MDQTKDVTNSTRQINAPFQRGQIFCNTIGLTEAKRWIDKGVEFEMQLTGCDRWKRIDNATYIIDGNTYRRSPYCGYNDSPPLEVAMAGGLASSSEMLPFHLITTAAMNRLAARIELGNKRKGDKSWNAISNNQACLLDKIYVMERIGHIIKHCFNLRDKINSDEFSSDEDDAAAIMWGGMFLCSAMEAMSTNQKAAENEIPKD